MGVSVLLMALKLAPVLAAPIAVVAAPQPLLAVPALPPASTAPVLSDEVIQKAVRETIAEDPRPLAPDSRLGPVMRADTAHSRMSAAFERAWVPDCLHDDALKHQPAVIGPVVVVGPYSLPWVVAAALRGKCR